MKGEARKDVSILMGDSKEGLFVSQVDSPLGAMTLLASQDALLGAWFSDREGPFSLCREGSVEEGKNDILTRAELWLAQYFSGQVPSLIVPLLPKGTPYQERVWEELRSLPYGKTWTYGELAKRIEERSGLRTSPRAVGQALSENPILLFLPCHRVVGKDGNLAGYRGGWERKRWLLEFERRNSGRR